MNIPNKLTVARIIMTPVFLMVLLLQFLPHRYLIACVIFIIASLTDLVDGKLARKNNQVTTFGKFLDPIADKILVIAAILYFLKMGISDVWVPMLILTREFIVTSVRLVASGSGKVIAASFWGKAKTVSQMAAIIMILLLQEAAQYALLPAVFPLGILCEVLLWISTVLTVISGIQYVWDYREYINTTK